jgi:hypothetical protein
LSHPPSHAGEEEEAKLKAFYRKTEKLESDAARKQAQMLLKILSGTLETTTDLLQFNAIKLKNLSKNTQLGLCAGNFDLSIKAIVEDPDYIRWLKDPMTSFSTAFIDIMMDTHLQNVEKELEMGVIPKNRPDQNGRANRQHHHHRQHRHHRSRHHRSPTPSDSYSSSSSESEQERKHSSGTRHNRHRKNHHPYPSSSACQSSSLTCPSPLTSSTTSTIASTTNRSSIGQPSLHPARRISSDQTKIHSPLLPKISENEHSSSALQTHMESQFEKYGFKEIEQGSHALPTTNAPMVHSSLHQTSSATTTPILPISNPIHNPVPTHFTLTSNTSGTTNTPATTTTTSTTTVTPSRKIRPFCPKPLACALPDLSGQIERMGPLISSVTDHLQQKEKMELQLRDLESTRSSLF